MLQIVLILTLILPWFTLLFLDKMTIKRYMPVTVFTSLLMTMVFLMAHQYNWWTIHVTIFPWARIIDASFAYGVFPVGTLWVFYLTFRNFWLYLVANLALDAFFAFVGLDLLDRFGVATIHRITEAQYFLVTLFIAVIIYGYQIWQEGALRPPSEQKKLDIARLFRFKAR